MEFWLGGPVEGVTPMLMPAAHTFLQVRHDVPEIVSSLSVDRLWQRPGRSASIGFHAVHIAGATDRLMTYARGQQMTEAQLADMRLEATLTGLEPEEIAARVRRAIDEAMAQVRSTTDGELLVVRGVGRKQLPSTTLGLITHAAEHALRHAGQIATLARVLS